MHGNKYLDGRKKSNYSSYRCHGRENKRSCKNRKIRRDYIDSFVLDGLYKRLFSKISFLVLRLFHIYMKLQPYPQFVLMYTLIV